MKSIYSTFLLIAALCFVLPVRAQRLITNATITSEIETIDKMNGTPIPRQQMTMWLKDGHLKVASKNDFTETFVYIDRSTEKITSLFEVFGRKTGFFLYDSSKANHDYVNNLTTVEYMDSSTTIAGIRCKKAVLKYAKELATNDVEVWYAPDIRFQDRNLGLNVAGIEKLNYAVMGFRTVVKENNFQVTFLVSHISENTVTDESIFAIPSAYAVKTYEEFNAEMQRQQGKN